MSEVRRPFTLLELVVVCAIIALAIGLGTTALRGRSGTAKFNRTVRSFQEFCAAARMQAMELGRDRVVTFRESDRKFSAGDPAVLQLPREEECVYLTGVPEELRDDTFQDPDGTFETPRTLAALEWQIPEEYAIHSGEDENAGTVTVAGGGEEKEVFRFFADGGASGSLRFTIRFGKLARTFFISPLTGRMINEEEGE